MPRSRGFDAPSTGSFFCMLTGSLRCERGNSPPAQKLRRAEKILYFPAPTSVVEALNRDAARQETQNEVIRNELIPGTFRLVEESRGAE